MDDKLLADAFNDFLTGSCTPVRVRQVEAEPAGAEARALWAEIEESGFADALTPEDMGGSGLGLADAALIAQICGRHAVPLPLPLSMSLRALLSTQGKAPSGPLTIAPAPLRMRGQELACLGVPYGLTADWLLVNASDHDWLLPTATATRARAGGHGSLAADITWPTWPSEAQFLPRAAGVAGNWNAVAAALISAQMAGAMARLLEMTIGYANDRVQFGKPIAKLQVIQQQISVMAEQTFAAHTASLIGLTGVAVDPHRAAVAKARCGEAAVIVTAVSHAVHGAIGVTDEYDLQLHTRRLHEWRGQYGGESYWQRQLGLALLADDVPPLEFVCQLV